MLKIGVTGSIGMGKSTAVKMFADAGAVVFDADAAVAELYAPGGKAVEPVSAAFPEALVEYGIDRAKLAACVLNNQSKLKKLESIVHPLVGEARAAFIEHAETRGAQVAVFEVPLLFETNGQTAFDAVVVVTAPEDVQEERVLKRPGMSREKFMAIRARQMPESEKVQRADYVIRTDQSLDTERAEILGVLSALGVETEDGKIVGSQGAS